MTQLPSRFHKPQRKQQDSECWILKHPVELLDIIYGHLPVASQICLGQTHLSMYNSLENTFYRLREEERLDLIALIARDLPDCCLAESRPWIRPVQGSDLTVISNGPPVFGNPSWNGPQIYHFNLGALLVEHQHVQLSIK
ncbi:hypothetical protein NW768_004440 [Fusarium equiseti]|uniref:F-box domain-containing protein n=1 Tax=Fusarium equiseti TaxID=61235 RepID=A0ABQ8RG75_FUSEQ|nr:hypothetical protein NW768_004440 [Fusarium equiseti]